MIPAKGRLSGLSNVTSNVHICHICPRVGFWRPMIQIFPNFGMEVRKSFHEVRLFCNVLFSEQLRRHNDIINSIFLIINKFKKGAYFSPIHSTINVVSKWAMADVFVVGLWILFLSANTMDSVTASMGPGFYYFTGYCLMSILGFQVYKVKKTG